jgi:hypothetical protein
MNAGFPQPLDQRAADLLGQRMAFRQLQVVLGLGRLVTGGDLAIGPVGLLQRLAIRATSSASNRPGM